MATNNPDLNEINEVAATLVEGTASACGTATAPAPPPQPKKYFASIYPGREVEISPEYAAAIENLEKVIKAPIWLLNLAS